MFMPNFSTNISGCFSWIFKFKTFFPNYQNYPNQKKKRKKKKSNCSICSIVVDFKK